jgi:putative zinc finger/helix-turn-helix YgiT family protein
MQEKGLPTGIQCPACGEGQLHSLSRTEEFEFDLGDETVKVRAENVPIKKCDKCGEETSGPAAAKVRHEAICRAVGLLTPAEIKALRERFGWSQQYLADLTDIGVATISRWERGRLLQNRSNNKVLEAIRDCPPFREYLERLLTAKTSKQESATANSNRPVAPPVNRVFARIKRETYAAIVVGDYVGFSNRN